MALALSALRPLHGTRRAIATCAKGLRPLEDGIGLGLRARLAVISEASQGPPRVAVVGQNSLEFIAALRACRAAGAAVAPVDVAGRTSEELCEVFAEAQIHLAVAAGPSSGSSNEPAVFEAARRLGASAASMHDLRREGLPFAGATVSVSSLESRAAPLLLLTTPPPWVGGAAKAAEVGDDAFSARVQAAVAFWGLSENDMVLSLGLESGREAALVDAGEAPLLAGATVALAELRSLPDGRIWDFWAAVHEHATATILFVDMQWCWQLVESYPSLAPSVRAELASRWAKRPFRHSVAVASLGTTMSQDLANHWMEVFKCPLTWHFSCAEAGSLYTVRATDAGLDQASACPPGLDWRVEDGNLRVRGESMFTSYRGRPRSTSEAFDKDGFFCQTGHRVSEGHSGALVPEPQVYDIESVSAMDRIIKEEPNNEPFPRMFPDWKVKKVLMRRYEMWKGAWGGLLYTKKHNQANKVYQSKRK